MSSSNNPPDPANLVPIQAAVVEETYYVPNYESFAVTRFVGTTDFSKGVWVGMELPIPTGKNDGSVKGKVYFPCKPQHGIFVRTTACRKLITSGGNDAAKIQVVNRTPNDPIPSDSSCTDEDRRNASPEKDLLPPVPGQGAMLPPGVGQDGARGVQVLMTTFYLY